MSIKYGSGKTLHQMLQWIGLSALSTAAFAGHPPAAFAAEPATSLPEVCARKAGDVQQYAYDPASRIAVANQGGLFNDGVCWWHSRLQRSALYLATFRPDLPKASYSRGLAIINELARMDRVVVIPGYATFEAFSRDYEREIIKRLEAWQISDGFLGFRWVDGLKGHWRLPAPTLQGIMERIHQFVALEHRVLFEKLHFDSVASHAYLVIGSRETTGGYDIDVIDSNHPVDTLTIHYLRGQTSLYTADGHKAVIPYLDYDGDMGRIDRALGRSCRAD